MSFLSPLWLALGAAVVVPVLLHLLRLRRGVQVEFPAVRFLLRAEREHRRELRLRNLALMLLRAAIVLAVALAAARPLGRAAGSGHAPTAIALVLDNSMSAMAVRGGGSTFEALGASARRILDAATADDRVWLLTVDGRVVTGAAPTVRDALGRVEAIGGAGDLVGAVERAAALVRGSGLVAATVVVLTDGQESQWPRAARTGGVPVTIVSPDDAPPPNRAVTAARPVPVRWVPRGAVELAVASDDSADVRVVLGERTLARTTLPPGGTMTVRGMADRAGWIAGRVELAPDELRGDDARHFAVFAGDAPAMRADASAGAFARAAVEALAAAGRVDVGGGIALVGADAVARVPALIVAPNDPVRLGTANRALAAAGVPWRFGEVTRGEASVRDGELAGVRVMTRYSIEATGGGSVDTLASAGGAPWVVAGEGYVLVASPLSDAATSLPLWPQFVPWVESLIGRYLLADGGRVLNAVPLEAVTLPHGVDELLGDDQRVVRVESRRTEAPARPGAYWMRRAGATVGALVVNPEIEESALRALDGDALAGRFADGNARRVATTGDVPRAAFSTAARRPLIGTILVLLVALLVVEAVVARAARVPARGPA